MDIINFYKKPVIFSAIGVESFDEDNYACKHLKNALNSKYVKMITTRDNIDALNCFVDGTDINVAKVSDPAVFCSNVLNDVVTQKRNKSKKKKIGVFVIRGNAFKDNRISFDKNQAIEMWLELAEKLEKKGYDYEFLTSGSHNDEVFLGRGFAHSRTYSEEVAKQIDSETKRIIQTAYDRAQSLLTEHIEKLHAVAEKLLEKEKIDGEEFNSIFE